MRTDKCSIPPCFRPFTCPSKNPSRRNTVGVVKIAISGFAAGAAFMYLTDPERGKRRRAIARDKGLSRLHGLSALVDKGSRDVANRASGIFFQAKSALGRGRADNDVLVQRVRSRIGRAVSHPHAIEVT